MKLTAFVLLLKFTLIFGHGRLIKPVSRASMWRFGYDTPHDYTDNQGFCGGRTYQHDDAGGRCGICGDPYVENGPPGEHEAPGPFANGIIVETFTAGDIIEVVVDITAHHWGYFQFRICPNDNFDEDPEQACFDDNVLEVYPEMGNIFDLPKEGNKNYTAYVKLPDGMTCSQCIFQWTYTTGNSWGVNDNGVGCQGCGPQETFRACSDISIVDSSSETDFSSTTRKTSTFATEQTEALTSTSTTTETSESEESDEQESSEEMLDCKGINEWENHPGIEYWCNVNCKAGHCPTNMCEC